MAARGMIYGNNGNTRLLGYTSEIKEEHYTLQIKDDDKNMTLLPPNFVPGRWDIICQRGKESFEHPGNKRFRLCVEGSLDIYMRALTRQKKADIVSDIIDAVQKDPLRPCAGFVKKDLLSRNWYRISKKETREKVGQALRDAIKALKASSNKKTKKRPIKSSLNDSQKNASADNYEGTEERSENQMRYVGR